MKRKEPEEGRGDDHPSKKGFWALGLLKTMKDPKYLLKKDDKITIIKDMYPKARYHYLVLPNEDISSLKSISEEHLNLLKHMEQSAREYIEENCSKTKSNFKYGFHAEASMHRLHLHAISDDMDSPALKTKKHWNSFNTGFFLNSNDVLENLEKNGRVVLPSKEKCKEYMATPLQCNKCSFKPKNMPDLKKHINTHL